MPGFIKNREKRQKFAHILAGGVILIHAYEKFVSGHDSYVFFALFGILFMSIAVFHHKLQKRFPWIDGVFFIIEGILSFIVAYDYFHMGKKALPFCYLAVGIGQMVVGIYKSFKRKTV